MTELRAAPPPPADPSTDEDEPSWPYGPTLEVPWDLAIPEGPSAYSSANPRYATHEPTSVEQELVREELRRGGVHFVGGGKLENDFMGRVLTRHWLEGGENLEFYHVPAVSEYMMSSGTTRSNLEIDLQREFLEMSAPMALEGGSARDFTFSMELDTELWSGERSIGYELLGGANPTVLVRGVGSVVEAAGGDVLVHYSAEYTWQDVIDPNLAHRTDAAWAPIGEIITLGQATDYEVQIIWSSSFSVVIPPESAQTGPFIVGWPGEYRGVFE